MAEARAYVAEVVAELAELNAEVHERLDGETRTGHRAADVLAWASLSAERLAHLGELGGDPAMFDDIAERILDVARQAVEATVPVVLEEEVPHLGRENVAEIVTLSLETLRAADAPITPAVPIIVAVLSWHVAVYEAMGRNDVAALRRLAIITPYENARRLAELFGGVLGPIFNRLASRFVCRARRTVELGLEQATAVRAPCRRRGPPGPSASTPSQRRHIAGTSPNAPPRPARNGAVEATRNRRGSIEGEPLRT
jgi:hypothetical protein